MPRRKKNGHSPSRVPDGPPEGVSLGYGTASRLNRGFEGVMANNFPPSTSLSSTVKEEIVQKMQEMFSHLDTEVIDIVLSECDFKVENAMDSLLELSVAAEVAAPILSPFSGFERTAAVLLSPCHFSEFRPDSELSRPSQGPSSPPSTGLLTEELDLLVDQELQILTEQQNTKDELHGSQYLSSFPHPQFPQQALPELLHSSLQPGSRGSSQGLVEQISGASSPLDQVSNLEDETVEKQQSMVDFTHLMAEASPDRTEKPFNLATSGRSSAFQVYKKQDPSSSLSDNTGEMLSHRIDRGARSKAGMLHQEELGGMQSALNVEAPVFSQRVQENHRPAFITPVAQPPSIWTGPHRHASHWLGQGITSQAPLKPYAPIPKSWALPTPQPPAQHGRLRLQGKVLVLLRGAAGSGKTTMARALVEHNPGGVTLSTDDYFTRHGEYLFDPTALGEAHAWNHNRAKEAFERGANPIIIDNTNMHGWEMRPYVVLALKHGYKVLFREPDTWWKNKPRELERRSSHNVPLEKIRRMLNEYERFVTVQSIMGSQMPDWKQRLSLDNRSPMSVSSEPPCPDLIGQPESTEECMKSRSQLCSSLPDVSSISHCSEIGLMEHGANKSTESINIQPTRRLTENPEISEGDNDMNSGGLDLELNAQVGLTHPAGDQRIPDCIVELVMNEDRRDDEMTVAFSDSIGQRVRRERSSRISGFNRLEPVDLVKDTNQSDSEACDKEKIKDKDADCFEMMTDGGEKALLQVSDFIGDWPCLGLLEQRQVKRRVKHKEGGGEKDDSVSQEANESQAKLRSSPKITEFQRLLDLIQTGVADIQTGSSLSSSPSLSSGGGMDQEEEASGRFEVSHSSSSNSEEREQNMNRASSNRSELPDCVINWRASDSCNVGESGIHDLEGLQTENESSNKGGNYNVGTASLDLKSGITPLSSLQAHSLLSSKCVEANLNNEIVIEPSVSFVSLFTNNTTASSRETTSEAGGNSVSEVCQSQMCEVSVETESGPCSGGSQERKQRQSRRSGKQCKLALTFTQNCPISSLNTLECPNVAVQSINSSIHADVKPKMDFNRTPYLDSNQDPLSDSKSEAHLQPPSPKLVDLGCPSQTEPQDFAFLWRLDHQDSSVGVAMNAYSQSCDIAVLSGVSSRFVPEMSAAVSAAVAVNPFSYREIPYHVVHEKSTQVEEKELGAIQDRLESLRILSCHFKLVGFDTLEDLYDKCHQDLEWTTNLLLDSGERFFREEDDQKMDKRGATDEENQKTFSQFGVSDKFVETRLCPDLLDEHHSECCPTRFEEGTPQSAIQILTESCQEDSGNANVQTVWGATVPLKNEDHPDTTSDLQKSPQTELNEAANKGEGSSNTEHEMVLEGGATGKSFDDGDIIQKSGVAIDETEEMASLQEVQRLLLAELDKMQQMESQKEREKPKRRHMEDGWSQHLEIQSVELKLPTEVALQLTELFGPVGVDAGTCCSDDHLVQMDLSLAKLLHQKWKETIQEKQRQATLSFHLLQESSEHWGDLAIAGPRDRMQTPPFLLSADGYVSLDSQSEAYNQLPYMNHWNVSQPHISLRAIMREEQALQENMKKMRHSRADLDRRDGATQLKENQLYSLFPTIDRHFLQDIFRDHNYNLTQTEIFLRSLLNEEEPVKTVVAPEAPRSDHHRTASKEREQRQKPLESTVPEYQDTDDPEYVDFRAEASLQKQRQLENLSKAAEAFKQGHKEVASFYAQQGHLHGRRMREANHRAAAQIFERVNASLLPNNILDLHGLHVDEALQHLAQVLKDKSTDCEQGLCRLQLSVITGRGNHSQGGVARIRPAVIDYLTNRHYRFTEPKPGLVLVSLK